MSRRLKIKALRVMYKCGGLFVNERSSIYKCGRLFVSDRPLFYK